MRSRSSAERSATQNSPSSVTSIHPTGPAYQPRSRSSSSAIAASASSAWLAAHRRGRVEQPGQLDRGARRGELSANGRRQVLDVRHPDQVRFGSGRHPDRVRAKRALDPARDDLVLGSILRRASQLLPEVIVDRRISAATGRARERDGGRPGAASPHEQLGTGAEEGALRRAAAEAEAGREPASEGRRRAPRGRGPPRASTRTSRASTIFSSSPDSIREHGVGDGALVALGRRGARHPDLGGRKGVEQRHRRRGERCEPPPDAGERRAGIGSRAGQRGHGEQTLVARAPERAAPASPSAPAEKTTTGAMPRRRGRRRTRRPRRARRPGKVIGLVGDVVPNDGCAGRDRVGEAIVAPGDDLSHAAQPGEREPVALGLLPAEPTVTGQARRENRRARVLDLGGNGDAHQGSLASPRRFGEPSLECLQQPLGSLGRDHSREWSLIRSQIVS